MIQKFGPSTTLLAEGFAATVTTDATRFIDANGFPDVLADLQARGARLAANPTLLAWRPSLGPLTFTA